MGHYFVTSENSKLTPELHPSFPDINKKRVQARLIHHSWWFWFSWRISYVQSQWIIPSKHLLVFKTSWRRLQGMSWSCLHYVFIITIFCLPRRFEDVLQGPLEVFLKTSWRRLWRRKTVTLKTSWRYFLKTSSRRFGDKQNVYWRYLYLTNLNLYLTNPYLTNLYLRILWKTQNALIKTRETQET